VLLWSYIKYLVQENVVMNREVVIAARLSQLKIDIRKWFKKRPHNSDTEREQSNRNAEELIWTFQERFGYSGIRRDRNH